MVKSVWDVETKNGRRTLGAKQLRRLNQGVIWIKLIVRQFPYVNVLTSISLFDDIRLLLQWGDVSSIHLAP